MNAAELAPYVLLGLLALFAGLVAWLASAADAATEDQLAAGDDDEDQADELAGPPAAGDVATDLEADEREAREYLHLELTEQEAAGW